MKRRDSTPGFTVIESMIFLSISSLVFISAIAGYSANQRTVQFNQGIRDTQAMIQDVINDVGSGFYSKPTQNCHADISNNNTSPDFSASIDQSAKSNCVWLGKAVKFGLAYVCHFGQTADQCDRYSVIPIVARRSISDSDGVKNPVKTFAEANPIALGTCLTNGDASDSTPCAAGRYRPDMSSRGRTSGGIGVDRMFVRTATGSVSTEIGAIIFSTALQSSSANKINAIDVVWVPGNVGSSESNIVDNIDASGSQPSDAPFLNPQYGITVCIKGASGQRSAIVIGVNNRQLDVEVQDTSNIDPGCLS